MWMSHPNMAVSWLLIGELHPTALHKAVVILVRGVPFHLLKVFMFGAQAQGDVPPLNEISKLPLIPSEIGSQVGNNLVIRTRSLLPLVRSSGTCPENPRLWVNFARLPPRAIGGVTLDLGIGCWVPVTACKAVSWQSQGVYKVRGDLVRWWCPYADPGTWGSYSPSGGPRFPWGAGGHPSDDCSIYIWDCSSPEERGFLSNDRQAGVNGCQDLNLLLLHLH